MSALREIAGPFVVAPPAGARVRTRLRVPGIDAAVLREVGEYLGSLASGDLAARCAEGRLDAKQRARSRQVRKQELTAKSSSRWAGALTRTSEDAYQLAHRNLLAERRSLLARIKRIETRLAVMAGKRAGRVRPGATRQSAGTRTRNGWRSGSPPRWRVSPTGPAGVTGCPARSSSPTGAAMLPRRPRPGPSAMTSPSTPHGSAGTSTHRGRRQRSSPSRWRRPGRAPSSRWT